MIAVQSERLRCKTQWLIYAENAAATDQPRLLPRGNKLGFLYWPSHLRTIWNAMSVTEAMVWLTARHGISID